MMKLQIFRGKEELCDVKGHFLVISNIYICILNTPKEVNKAIQTQISLRLRIYHFNSFEHRGKAGG